MFYALILVAAAARFLPHPPNVACIGAIGLLAGCQLRGVRAFVVPALVLFLSDLVGTFAGVHGMGFYHPITMAAVYGGATASVVLGRWIDGGRWSTRVPAASIASSTVFFIVSNAGVAVSGWYPMTLAGLSECYIAALPFYGLTLIGDLAFSTLLFSVTALATHGLPVLPRRRRWFAVATPA